MSNLDTIQLARIGNCRSDSVDRIRFDGPGDIWASLSYPAPGQPLYRVWVHDGGPLHCAKFSTFAGALDFLAPHLT